MRILRGDADASINWQGGKKDPAYYTNYDLIDWSVGRKDPTPVKIVRPRARPYYSTMMLEVKEVVAEARKPVHLKKNLVG